MSKTDKKEFTTVAFLSVDKVDEPEVQYLYKVINTSKGTTPVDGYYFNSKEQAKIHRNNLNEEAGKERKYQLRKGPDHWRWTLS
jgi:hypothetical protein